MKGRNRRHKKTAEAVGGGRKKARWGRALTKTAGKKKPSISRAFSTQTPSRIATPLDGGHTNVDLKPDALAERVRERV